MKLLWMLLLPIIVKADYNVSNYEMDLTILENGDVKVIEVINMTGTYNGFERIIDYKNNFNNYKKISLLLTDSTLYDYKRIELIEIKGINYSNEDILSYKENGDLFKKVYTAVKGNYGVYEVKKKDNISYKIYNSSTMNKSIYLEYIIKDAVISHSDLSELLYYTNFYENILNLKITIHAPGVTCYTHQKNYEKLDENTINIYYKDITSIDFRIVFDIIDASKKTNLVVKDKIIEIENNYDDTDDPEYEKLKEEAYSAVNNVLDTNKKTDYLIAKEAVEKLDKNDKLKMDLLVKLINIEPYVERTELITKIILSSLIGIWVIGLFIIIYQIYKKYPLKKCITDKHYEPYIIGYTIKKKLDNNDLIASILYLNYKGTIDIKNNRLIKNNKKTNPLEEKILKILFNDKDEITFTNLKRRIIKNPDEFLHAYTNWFNKAHDLLNEENLFIDLTKIKIISIIYSILGIILSIFLLGKNLYTNPLIVIIISLIFIIYIVRLSIRTDKGNMIYFKYKKLKFESDQELYLIYCISLNYFDNLYMSGNVYNKYQDFIDKINDIIRTAYVAKN